MLSNDRHMGQKAKRWHYDKLWRYLRIAIQTGIVISTRTTGRTHWQTAGATLYRVNSVEWRRGETAVQLSVDVTLDAVEAMQAAEERAETTPQAEPDYSAVEGFLEQLPMWILAEISPWDAYDSEHHVRLSRRNHSA